MLPVARGNGLWHGIRRLEVTSNPATLQESFAVGFNKKTLGRVS